MRRLSQTFAAPRFEPHVTLVSDVYADPPSLQPLITRIAAQHAPLGLRIRGLQTTERLFKTLFLTFERSEPLDALYRDFREAIPSNAPKQFEPHLSLLYASLPETERQALTERISVDISEIVFDAVWLITSCRTKEDVLHVEGWKCAFVERLGG